MSVCSEVLQLAPDHPGIMPAELRSKSQQRLRPLHCSKKPLKLASDFDSVVECSHTSQDATGRTGCKWLHIAIREQAPEPTLSSWGPSHRGSAHIVFAARALARQGTFETASQKRRPWADAKLRSWEYTEYSRLPKELEVSRTFELDNILGFVRTSASRNLPPLIGML